MGAAKSIWSFIPPEKFSPPSPPAREAVRSGWRAIFRRFSRPAASSAQAAKSAFRPPRERPAPSSDHPMPPWDDAVPELAQALSPWPGIDPARGAVRVVVGGPHGGIQEIVRRLAERERWRLADPPSPGEILSGDPKRLEALHGKDEAPIVIAALERWFLRHPDGHGLVRGLFDRLQSMGSPCLIGCDSWAWAYLDKATTIGGICHAPFAPAPFDANRLRALLDDPFGDEESDGSVYEQEILAATCRGNPGVAWAIRHHAAAAALRETKEPGGASAGRGAVSLYRTSGGRSRPLGVPAGIGRLEAFILHAVLLHGGVSAALLPEILDLPAASLSGGASRLLAAGLVEESSNILHVTPVAYPAVREFLVNLGFLADAL